MGKGGAIQPGNDVRTRYLATSQVGQERCTGPRFFTCSVGKTLLRLLRRSRKSPLADSYAQIFGL